MPSSPDGFGIYVHWPFCKAKCPYCDFNSHVRRRAVDARSFAASLATELAWFAGQAPDRIVTSIFFGGGTPSLMPPAAVAHVLDAIARRWPVAADAEVTLEANPTSVEAENFAGYRAAGVNRVSVGVQALADADLKYLGRQHTVAEALAAYRLAARIFPRASFDLIYARPRQTVAAWRAELARALAECPSHMSLYQLTIEPGTAFGDLAARGRLETLDDNTAADLYEVTQEVMDRADLPAYEISNHAMPGQECRHNLLYWRYGEYIGVGPGAHSRLGVGRERRAIVAEKHPETWRAAVERRGHGIAEDTTVAPVDQASEYLLMGLRTAEGIDLARHAALSGKPLDAGAIGEFVSQGFLERGPHARHSGMASPQGPLPLAGRDRVGVGDNLILRPSDAALPPPRPSPQGGGRPRDGLCPSPEKSEWVNERLAATPKGRRVLNALIAAL